MLVKVDGTLKTLDGTVIMDNDGKGNAVEATVRMALVNAILSPVQQETGMEKVKKYELAKKIHDQDEVELSMDDIELIKDRVGEIYAPVVVGQLYSLLSG
jgi:hypothetical protein